MTWSARITRPDGTTPTREGATAPDYQACQSCQHADGCHVSSLGNTVAYGLTAVDRNPKTNHMASGTAVLMCGGYEPKVEA